MIQDFVDYTGATFPILLDRGEEVLYNYGLGQEFWSAAYPQDWIIGADFKVAYASTSYEPDAMIAVIEDELGR